MKDLLTALALLLALGGCEGALWMRNPLQVPNGFGPARACGFQVFQELDNSMQPGVSAGHHVLVSAWPYWWEEPQVGDVVAFVYPRDAALADLKRIVAGAGSTVEIRQGVLYVDGGDPSGRAVRRRSALYERVRVCSRQPLLPFHIAADHSAP